MRKILAVFAHPDDEAFGPGGTLGKYGNEGAEIHLLCATRGESGEWHEESRTSNQEARGEKKELHNIREDELLESAKVLGIGKVEFLDFIDGELRNNIYHKLSDRIADKIARFRPDVILTNERLGVSGHLDHIAVSLTTTHAHLRTKIAKKLYYFCIPKKYRDPDLDSYFIYFPEGYDQKEITTRIDYSEYYGIKKKAMHQHKSQMKDVKRILSRLETQEKTDHFILQHFEGFRPSFPELDLFQGL